MDLVTVEILQKLLLAAAEEMGITLIRAAYSPNIKERRDASCAVFDVERDPGDQDLALADFDAVYATNVMHATADVTAALRNVASLLRPGGLLMINEITQPSDFATLTFGLTPGWWRFRARLWACPFW